MAEKENAEADVFFPFDCFILQICTLGFEDLLSAPYICSCVLSEKLLLLIHLLVVLWWLYRPAVFLQILL